jgi:ClpP class serine protease
MNVNTIAKLTSAKWALHPSALKTITLAVNKLASFEGSIDTDFEVSDNVTILGNVGIITVDGILSQHVSDLEAFFGFTDVEDIKSAIEELDENPLVDKIVLYVNSPGGSTAGVNSTAEAVRGATKPVYAYSDSVCASAAYWWASNAQSGVYGTDDAEFGAVGIYALYTSDLAFLDKEGFAPTLIKSGKYKAIGVAPLSDDEKAIKQGETDKLYDTFKATILSVRPQISDDDLQGLVYSGQDAIDKGFVDGFVDSIDEMIFFLRDN